MKTYNKRIRRNTYLNRDKYLGGYVLFHNFEGQFVNGWEYKGGKIIHRIVPAGKGTSGTEKEKLKLSILPAGYTVSPRLYTPISTRSGFEDHHIIDGGWFDDVIITPDDPDPDWPDPDWPDWPNFDDPEDWDDGDIWGDWDDYDDWDHNEDNEFEEVISEVETILNAAGINIPNVPILKVENCHSNARIPLDYSRIELCFGFSNKGRNEQASILFHEIFHLKNDNRDGSDKPRQMLDNPIVLNPTQEIESKMKEEIFNDTNSYNIIPEILESVYLANITYNSLLSPEYYQNEIEAYRAEIEMFPDVSREYEIEREIILWINEQLLEYANQYYAN